LQSTTGKNKVRTKISLPRFICGINYTIQHVPSIVINANFARKEINQKQGKGIFSGA
jgi:hypothetical protein